MRSPLWPFTCHGGAAGQLTDPMLTEYGKVRQQFADSLKKAQASVVATPAGASLTAFDDDRGTASAIVAINVTASSTNQQPTQKQQLFQVEMQRTPDGWKASQAAPTTRCPWWMRSSTPNSRAVSRM